MFIVKGGNQCCIQEAKSRLLSQKKKIYVTSLLQSKCSMDLNPCLQKVHMGGRGGDHF